MGQFNETNGTTGTCALPGCENPVVIRSVRDTRSNKPSYCSRICASQPKFGSRYTGTLAGPLDKPTLIEKTK